MLEYLLDLAAATLRLSTPLIFAAMGGLISERSGVINIALEGKMVVGAFAAAVVTLSTGSPWIGLIGGGLAGVLLAVLYGGAVLPLKANQIVAGTGINMLAFGIPPFVAKILYDVTGSTPAISLAERFSVAPMVLAVLLPLVIWSFLSHTRGGLWLQFAGEHPSALAAAGVNVRRIRWASVLTAGFLAGVGGATLSIFLSSAYSRNMTSGRGFIALAALILGKWRPMPVLFACLFFGLADAVQMRLQGIQMDGFGKVPVQFIQILPYMITIVVLAGFVGRSRAPRALGNS